METVDRAIAFALALLHAQTKGYLRARRSILGTAGYCAQLELLPEELEEGCVLIEVLDAVRQAAPEPAYIHPNLIRVAEFDLANPHEKRWFLIGQCAVRQWTRIEGRQPS